MNAIDKFTERIFADAARSRGQKLPGDFIREGGAVFAGRHILVDFWGASRLNDKGYLEDTLHSAVRAAGATMLHLHLHVFTPLGGLSGVAVLSESHISIHTWPEYGFAAADIFMCGEAHPHRALAVLRARLRPETVSVSEHKRGVSA